MSSVRLDFNQHGSWRKGPDFSEANEQMIMDAAADLADLLDAKLRIVITGPREQVLWYRDPGGFEWRKAGGAA